MSLTCSQCGSTNIDSDTTRGNAVCVDCGAVIRNELLVSEIEFEETSGGRFKAVGQFVHEGETGATSLGGLHGKTRESREATLYNAKRHITAMANALKMPSHLIDMAHNFYKLALEQGLTKGRKMSHIVASCLYIVARLEGTPHMLLDFCDLAQANVVVVCKCYMKITMALCINLPPTDPSVYIPRFAEKLGFGDKAQQVAMTALRIAQRMKRDWMVLGRRPSGLCGAALLFAARIHGFNRTIENIAPVVKISETTIRSRVLEFEETYAAALTVQEFIDKNEDETLPEADPPSYERGRCIDALLESELKNFDFEKFEQSIAMVEQQIEKEMNKLQKTSRARCDPQVLNRFTEEIFGETELKEDQPSVDDFLAEMNAKLIESYAFEETSCKNVKEWAHLIGHSLSFAEEKVESDTERHQEELTKLDEIDEKEIDDYILSKDEAMRRAKMWLKANADWLREQRLKEIRKREEEDERQANPHYKPRKPFKKRQKPEPIQANTISEALTAVIKEKKLQTKVNCDIIQQLDELLETGEDEIELPQEHEVTEGPVDNTVGSNDSEDESEEEEDFLKQFRGGDDDDDGY